uniref:inositol polyphosphate 5-phosphatase K isoform X2 n=1 Tax=Myxine glutinosa TaxID=7769 RepID=UPI00358ED29B
MFPLSCASGLPVGKNNESVREKRRPFPAAGMDSVEDKIEGEAARKDEESLSEPSEEEEPEGDEPRKDRGAVVGEVVEVTDSEKKKTDGGPRQKLRIRTVTWNVAGADPPSDLSVLLGLDAADGPPDMVAIGLQELRVRPDRLLWDALLGDAWSLQLMHLLAPHGLVRLEYVRLQGTLILIFLHVDLLSLASSVSTSYTRTGLYGYWGNKGGVSIHLTMGTLSLCFLNCHLPAHLTAGAQRLENLKLILTQLAGGTELDGAGALSADADGVEVVAGGGGGYQPEADLLFCLGDLNSRIDDYGNHFIKKSITSGQMHHLLVKDQLNAARLQEPFLAGFHEGPLRFPPTYKFDIGSDNYDSSQKRRKPAWTDRILWRMKGHSRVGTTGCTQNQNNPRISLEKYESHPSFTTSDHKPVSACFNLLLELTVREPLVTLWVMGSWNHDLEDEELCFALRKDFTSSSWDWIGLFREGFWHHKDYVSYMWAQDNQWKSGIEEYRLCFPRELIPKGGGAHRLGYYGSAHGHLVGMSPTFSISPKPQKFAL